MTSIDGNVTLRVDAHEEVVVAVVHGLDEVREHLADDVLLVPRRHEDRDRLLGGFAEVAQEPRALAAGPAPEEEEKVHHELVEARAEDHECRERREVRDEVVDHQYPP